MATTTATSTGILNIPYITLFPTLFTGKLLQTILLLLFMLMLAILTYICTHY